MIAEVSRMATQRMRSPEAQRAWDIMKQQRERRKSFRCALCPRREVPRYDPAAVPMCPVHAGRNMIEWTDEYRYCESYLSTVARANGPETLSDWVKELDLTLFAGVTMESLDYVLELMQFWGTVPAKTSPTEVIIFGPKRRPPVAPEQRYDGTHEASL
jgi:hypothetical protein